MISARELAKHATREFRKEERMKGYEITKQLRNRRGAGDQFIKWWRKENDFLDYDLIDRYVANFSASEEIYDFDLLSLDEMWEEVERICSDRVTKISRDGNDYISWLPPIRRTSLPGRNASTLRNRL